MGGEKKKNREQSMNENSTEMSEDHDDGADLEWVPPTEAEQKVINARRERSDKISKLMGDYMLKGYKMLATTCGVQKHGGTCGTIELEDKRGKIYCVACQEVDCEENSKDNPAVNPIAARNQLAEGQLEDIESQIIPNQNQVVEDIVQERRIHQINADPTICQSITVSPLRIRSSTRPLSTRTSDRGHTVQDQTQNPLPVLHTSMGTVLAKMAAASEALAETDDIEVSNQIVELIKNCADCVQSLKSASNLHQ